MLDVAFEKRLPDFTVRLAFRHESGVLALFGVSGAGKSVTLQTIAGLTRPDSGWIALNGEPLVDVRRRVYVPPERRSVGYVPQHYALFPHLTVVQNIAFGLGGVPKGERRSRIDDLLTLLDLAPLADRRPAQL
ncbi:MAG: ATP-binding cassette domain-containing protein, partial [Dehalococcoidia bacterium]|nr:ATP-binding cassette domain-containing protein [Dehalococcoidia bacterium]